MEESLTRGDVCMVRFESGIGSVQTGARPAVVIQNDIGNKYSPTVIVAPITSRLYKAKMPTHVMIPSGIGGLIKDSMVMAEQIQTVDKAQIDRKLGSIPIVYMGKVNDAVRISIAV